MTNELPLEVLGLMAPILCWVEGTEGMRLPEPWLGAQFGADERVTAWLTRELPTYSRDNLQEIRILARRRRDAVKVRTLSRARGGVAGGAGRLRTERPPTLLDPPERYDLGDAFDRLADRYFQWTGNELCIRSGQVEELHELALRFPVRHLVRHRHARAVATGLLPAGTALDLPEQMSRLHTTSQGIRSVVDEGLAEGHLHLWGVATADEAWADHLLKNLPRRSLESFSAAEERLLILSRFTVRLLALGLLHAGLGLEGRELPFELIPLLDRLYAAPPETEEEGRRLLQEGLQKAIAETPGQKERDPLIPPAEMDWILELLDPAAYFFRYLELPRPGRGTDSALGGIRRRLKRVERLHFAVQRLLVELSLPAASRAPDSPYLSFRDSGRIPLWQYLHDLFYRYLVLHTHHWHLATQSGRTTGLREFKRFYGAEQREFMAEDWVEVQGWIFERLSGYTDLKILEGRVSPPRHPAELTPWILAYARAAELGSVERFGLVIHFLKSEEREELPLEDEPPERQAERPDLLRHGVIRRTTRARAFDLFRLLSTPHPAVPFVVGIDAANLELTTPPEVFAPSFRFLREYPISLQPGSVVDERVGCHREVTALISKRRLGMTFHVGEDFRHLLSGLRAIHEVIEFLHPWPGDRLGHAIALAVEPRVWASEIGYQAVVPRQEALDSLVWLVHFLGAGHDVLGELGVEEWIQQLSRRIYGHRARRRRRAGRGSEPPRERFEGLLPQKEEKEGEEKRAQKKDGDDFADLDLSPQTLYDAMRLRQLDPACLDTDALRRGVGRLRPATSSSLQDRRWNRVQEQVLQHLDARLGSDDAYKLTALHWYDRDVRREGGQIITIDMQKRRDLWLSVCEEVQDKMRRLVVEKQLVIEVNPSSNRVVGPISRFDEHHVFRLTLDEENRPVKEIRVTINTDDPGVFNTSLAHEYYLLAEILLRRGVPEPRVVEWLRWLRRNGETYSFVRDLPGLDDPNVKRLVEELRRLNRSVVPRLSGEVRSTTRSILEMLEPRETADAGERVPR